MKYDINNLYFAKCRHCIMDIIMTYYEDDKEIIPRPDYVDYYTILLFKDGKYINIFDKESKYIDGLQITNKNEHYDEDIILKLYSLDNYLTCENQRISTKEAFFIESTIEKTKKLKREYGYKKSNI